MGGAHTNRRFRLLRPVVVVYQEQFATEDREAIALAASACSRVRVCVQDTKCGVVRKYLVHRAWKYEIRRSSRGTFQTRRIRYSVLLEEMEVTPGEI